MKKSVALFLRLNAEDAAAAAAAATTSEMIRFVRLESRWFYSPQSTRLLLVHHVGPTDNGSSRHTDTPQVKLHISTYYQAISHQSVITVDELAKGTWHTQSFNLASR